MNKKIYVNLSNGEETISAAQAFKWHKAGHDLHVLTGFLNLHRVFIHGAEQPHKISSSDENRNMCKSIALELEAYAGGKYSRCPKCGEVLNMADHTGEKYKCPECGAVNDTKYFEQCSLWDYFQDYLDIDWILNSSKEYKACRILVAFGGPNIYIDTFSGYVELYWWNETARYKILSDTIDAVNDWAEEMWACL